MSHRTVTFFFVAALTMFVLALAGAGCGAGNLPFDDGLPDGATPDATTSRPETGGEAGADADPETGTDGGVTATFNVSGAASTGRSTMTVTFDAPPDAALAAVLGNYSVPGLTLSGTPSLSGNVVTLQTTAQAAQAYTVTVSGVTRQSDGAPLATATKTFAGSGAFSVTSAAAPNAKVLTVTFDAPPDAAQAGNAANFTAPGLTLSAPQLAGNVVTLTTSEQSAQTYTVTVAGLTRASDAEPLTLDNADFAGRTSFNVTGAQSTNSATMTVTFDAPPNAAMATTLANYTVPGLALAGVPVLAGNVVTLTTAPQAAQSYTLTVSNVTRASDAEPLDVKTATFNGTAVLAPTVTNVVVTATIPNNGTTPYNTGTTTVTITGTDFITVACPAGVALDDLDGVGGAVGTNPTACTVDSDTQITATFPAGIRTNGATGWNVRVTNVIATNATSSVRFVPLAGLVVSEVYTGKGGGGLTTHEFIEIYNPTGTTIDTTAAGIGLKLHIRNGAAVPSDTSKVLALVTTGLVPSHGFLLVVSSASDAGDAWYASRDYTFSAGLVGDGGVYLSLSATEDAKVIDKVGWGTQAAGGYEGTAATALGSSVSIERLPAGGAGHATDTDVNVNDFTAPNALITPRGIADGAQP